jgi:hypothetical protein
MLMGHDVLVDLFTNPWKKLCSNTNSTACLIPQSHSEASGIAPASHMQQVLQ